MSDRDIPTTVSDLLREIKTTQEQIVRADAERVRMIQEKADRSAVDKVSADLARHVAALQGAVDSLSKKVNRPGGSSAGERSNGADQARGLLEMKHLLRQPKADPDHSFNPSMDDVAEAEIAQFNGTARERPISATTVRSRRY
jgi:hypothetical protein